MIVLTLNGGSSSLKFGLYRSGAAVAAALMTGEADDDGLRARDASGAALAGAALAGAALAGTAPADAALPGDAAPARTIAAIARLIDEARLPPPDAVAHRIVHGGARLRSHCPIDPAVLAAIDQARALSPLHAPAALAIIALAQARWPAVPHIACFDTVFHLTMPAIARTLPLPAELRESGIERYGFHGLSCESIVHQLGPDLPSRAILAHLGHGASVTALRDGRSIDTSMGLTPAGGIIMGTRPGDLDPGILLHLLRERGYDGERLEQLIDRQSGLLGLSGRSGDMRALHAAADDPDAQRAIASFCLAAAKQIAALTIALGGTDAILFTGGIGEQDAAVRAAICRHLAPIGVRIDRDRNAAAAARFEPPGAPIQLHRRRSQEDAQMARHAWRLLAAAG